MKYDLKVMQLTCTLFILILISSAQISEAKTTFEEITYSLWCPCDCDMLLSNCECEYARQLDSYIEQMLSQSKTANEIIFELEKMYGDKIIATPQEGPLKNILWIVPVMAASCGTGIIYVFASRKSKNIWYETKDFKIAEAKYNRILDEYRKQIETEYQ